MCRNLELGPRAARSKGWIAYVFLAALWLELCVTPVWAHKVMIFAWVEGDTVYTESKFSGGRKAKNSTVVVYDKEGNQLLEGKTDEEGRFSFRAPKKTDLKVALKASMGHLAEWDIPAEEIMAAAPVFEAKTEPEADVDVVAKEAAPPTDTKATAAPSASTGIALSRQEVKALIDESLDRKLTPIISMLAEQLGRGPGVGEVMGGIGYIFGLVGVALYFLNRRRRG